MQLCLSQRAAGLLVAQPPPGGKSLLLAREGGGGGYLRLLPVIRYMLCPFFWLAGTTLTWQETVHTGDSGGRASLLLPLARLRDRQEGQEIRETSPMPGVGGG